MFWPEPNRKGGGDMANRQTATATHTHTHIHWQTHKQTIELNLWIMGVPCSAVKQLKCSLHLGVRKQGRVKTEGNVKMALAPKCVSVYGFCVLAAVTATELWMLRFASLSKSFFLCPSLALKASH